MKLSYLRVINYDYFIKLDKGILKRLKDGKTVIRGIYSLLLRYKGIKIYVIYIKDFKKIVKFIDIYFYETIRFDDR